MWPFYDCDTPWGISMIVKLPVATFLGLSDCGTSSAVSMIVAMSVASNGCDISSGLFIIVTLPRASL